MKLFNIFSGLFSDNISAEPPEMDINPANGMPMVEDAGIDILGNPYGIDLSDSSDSGGGCSDTDSFDFNC